MGYIPVSSALYIFNAIACIWFGFRALKSYKKTGNEYSLMFVHVGFGAGLGFLWDGVPVLITTKSSVLGFSVVVGIVFTVWGLIQSSRVALRAWGAMRAERVIFYLMPALTIVYVTTQTMYLPMPAILQYGVIDWNIFFPFNLFFSLLITPLAVITGIFLFISKTESQKAIVKKTLFSMTFMIGGLAGGIGVIWAHGFMPLLLSYITMAFGFLMLYIMIFVDFLMGEEKTATTKTQVFASNK